MELKFTNEKKITNYEKIKSMSLDEMAHFFGAGMGEESVAACSPDFCPNYYDDGGCKGEGPDRCIPAYKAWLESEATDGSRKNKV